MAKNMYFGVDGTPRRVKNIYFGVDGVARKVKAAFIGIDSVARQFWPSVITLTTTGEGRALYCRFTYNGTRYYAGGQTLNVNAGETIDFLAYGYSASRPGTIIIDGTTVATATARNYARYTWTIPNATAITVNFVCDSNYQNGQITVTTT